MDRALFFLVTGDRTRCKARMGVGRYRALLGQVQLSFPFAGPIETSLISKQDLMVDAGCCAFNRWRVHECGSAPCLDS